MVSNPAGNRALIRHPCKFINGWRFTLKRRRRAIDQKRCSLYPALTNTVAGPGFLAGEYVGASGEVTVAAGLGANVLVGGSNRTVALQPISLGGQTGLNVAIGVAALHLGLPRQ
jgi:Protein of unknown function (DUF992)